MNLIVGQGVPACAPQDENAQNLLFFCFQMRIMIAKKNLLQNENTFSALSEIFVSRPKSKLFLIRNCKFQAQ